MNVSDEAYWSIPMVLVPLGTAVWITVWPKVRDKAQDWLDSTVNRVKAPEPPAHLVSTPSHVKVVPRPPYDWQIDGDGWPMPAHT